MFGVLKKLVEQCLVVEDMIQNGDCVAMDHSGQRGKCGVVKRPRQRYILEIPAEDHKNRIIEREKA